MVIQLPFTHFQIHFYLSLSLSHSLSIQNCSHLICSVNFPICNDLNEVCAIIWLLTILEFFTQKKSILFSTFRLRCFPWISAHIMWLWRSNHHHHRHHHHQFMSICKKKPAQMNEWMNEITLRQSLVCNKIIHSHIFHPWSMPHWIFRSIIESTLPIFLN